MEKIVECVPNFSEGRRKDVIDAISKAITNTDGCLLLDVDPGISTNRTVYTFVGSPEAVVDGALAAAHVAYNLIDMSTQHGSHPRIGSHKSNLLNAENNNFNLNNLKVQWTFVHLYQSVISQWKNVSNYLKNLLNVWLKS